MTKQPDEQFTVKLKNGQDVEVSWYKNYLSGMDHLELRGPMTSTGYRSEFLQRHDPSKSLDRDEVIEHARNLAQALFEENEQKYGKQTTLFGDEL